MKYRWDKKYKYWGITAFLALAAVVTYTMLLLNLPSIGGLIGTLVRALSGIIWGIVFAYLMSPIVNFLERTALKKLPDKIFKKKPGKGKRFTRGIAVALAEIFGISIVTAMILLVFPQFFQSIGMLASNMSSYLVSARSYADDMFAFNEDIRAFVVNFIDGIGTNFSTWVQTELLPNVDTLITAVSSGVVAVASVVINIFVGIIASIYLMYHKETFIAQSKRVLYSILPKKWCDGALRAFSYTHKKIGGFISGKIIDSFIVGIICLIAMLILRMPYPSLIAIVIGVTNLIPFFGPFIGAIPCAFIILLIDPVKCLIFIVFILILQQVDGNIIGPKVLGSATGMSGFWVMFAITVGGSLFGLFGMLLSVPVFATVYSGITVLNERLLKKKKLPTKTSFYRGEGAIEFDPADTDEPDEYTYDPDEYDNGSANETEE